MNKIVYLAIRADGEVRIAKRPRLGADEPEFRTVAEAVDALTNPIRSRTRYQTWHGNNRKTRTWQAQFPSLLHQLEQAAIPGETYIEDTNGTAHRTPASCPPARLEAINLSLAITAWAADKTWQARITVRENTTANLRALVGAYPAEDRNMLNQLRRWIDQARVLAGWNLPPMRLKTPCPQCDTPDALRVRLDQQRAACTQCRATWDNTTIGLLAEHVRRADATTGTTAALSPMITAGRTTMPRA